MSEPCFNSSQAVLTVLSGIAACFFFLEQKTKWKFFDYVPPLLLIYAVPVLFSSTGMLPTKSVVYDSLSEFLLPIMLTLLLIGVDIRSAVKVMGRGLFVVLMAIAGVIIGAPFSYWLVHHQLPDEAWKSFGVLAGSYIGGTGNMAAVGEALHASGTDFGLAVLANNIVYLLWLPLLIGSKKFAANFDSFSKVSEKRLAELKKAAELPAQQTAHPEIYHYIYLIFIGLFVAWVSSALAPQIPELPPVLTEATYRILLITSFGILLSFTPVRQIPGSQNLSMAFVYLFIASVGARAEISGLAGQAPWFIFAAIVWVIIHGLFVMLGAKLARVDLHTAAVASAAIIGGVATAPVVAAQHSKTLVPVSILMALVGYTVGNYASLFTAYLCTLIK